MTESKQFYDPIFNKVTKNDAVFTETSSVLASPISGKPLKKILVGSYGNSFHALVNLEDRIALPHIMVNN